MAHKKIIMTVVGAGIILVILGLGVFFMRPKDDVLQVKSPDGKVEMTFPQSALDGKIQYNEIRIEAVSEENLPVKFNNDAFIAAYQLSPDGATFSKPVRFTARIPYSSNVVPDLSTVSSDGKIEPIQDLDLRLDLDKGELTAQGTLLHFSVMVVQLSHFKLEISDPLSYLVGENFFIKVDVSVANPELTFDLPKSEKKARLKITDSYNLSGSIFTSKANAPIVSPAFVKDIPKEKEISSFEPFSEVTKFTCVQPGVDYFEYRASMKYVDVLTFENVGLIESLAQGEQEVTRSFTMSVFSKVFSCNAAEQKTESRTLNTNQTNSNANANTNGAENPNVEKVETLLLDGAYYPKIQFIIEGPDKCDADHYHAGPNGIVYTLGYKSKPDPGGCGYGKVSEVRTETIPVDKNEWTTWKQKMGIE